MTFPLILTLTRLLVAPILMPFLIIMAPHGVSALVFVLFALTDYLDGWYARAYHQQSQLGSLLDPLADKLLVVATLVGLIYTGRVAVWLLALVVARELVVSSVREAAALEGRRIAVNWLGKLKTVVQMVYLTYALAVPYSWLNVAISWKYGYRLAKLHYFNWWTEVEAGLLLWVVTFTVISGFWYCREYYEQFRKS